MTPIDTYQQLVRLVRDGVKFRLPAICLILAAANKTAADLVAAALTTSAADGPQPGDPCECGGFVVVRSSRRQAGCQVQYLACDRCHRSVGRRVIPGASIRRRHNSVVVTTVVPLRDSTSMVS